MSILSIFNRRLRKHIIEPYCTLVIGDRGVGKSSLFALIAETYLKMGLTVYCQYPYAGVNMIPMREVIVEGVTKYDIDKSWLYSADLKDCAILIDECRTIWPARSYQKWSQSDDEFFNFLRKYNMHLFLATQIYDAVDLNVKRASDETLYLTKGHFNFTHIESSHTTVAKVADRNTEVLGRGFKQGFRKVAYDVVEVPIGRFRFYRKPYYDKFATLYTYEEKKVFTPTNWNDVFDFKKKEVIDKI